MLFDANCSICGSTLNAKNVIHDGKMTVCYDCIKHISSLGIKFGVTEATSQSRSFNNEIDEFIPGRSNAINRNSSDELAKNWTPKEVKKVLDKYVIGQEHAKRVLSVAAYEHYKRQQLNDPAIQKSNVLLVGPSGCGKTYLMQTLAKAINVPLAICPATTLTEAGYKGDDVQTIVSALYRASNKDLKLCERGIIFIDEIDKIAVHGESHGQDVSREGVQRDILPIVEGSNVNTKFGVVDTTHILFIAAGAFSVAAPSDLIPELQGRFPLRVELDSLHKEDFKRILKEPKNSLIMQYTSLLETEGVKLDITEDALDRMSVVAEEVNASAENIGARRLHTIMEKVLADINFEADEHKGETIKIDAAYVDSKLTDIRQNQDLSRYIL